MISGDEANDFWIPGGGRYGRIPDPDGQGHSKVRTRNNQMGSERRSKGRS